MNFLTVAYSAVGAAHFKLASISAASVKRHMPFARTLVITDQFGGGEAFDRLFSLSDLGGSALKDERRAKLNKSVAILAADTENVLYVDNDTVFLSDVSHVFGNSSTFDLAASYDTWQFPDIYRRLNGGLPHNDPPPSEPFFNTGVLFVRKTARLAAFLHRWRDRFLDDERIVLEQLVFREELYSSDLCFRVLTNAYNARLGEPAHFSGLVRIAHSHLARHGTPSLQPLQDVATFLNSTHCNRVYLPSEGRLSWMSDLDFSMHTTTFAEWETRHSLE